MELTIDNVIAVIKAADTVMEADNLEPGTNFTSIGGDSMDLMNIIVDLDAEFGLTIPDDFIEDIQTPQDIFDKLVSLTVNA